VDAPAYQLRWACRAGTSRSAAIPYNRSDTAKFRGRHPRLSMYSWHSVVEQGHNDLGVGTSQYWWVMGSDRRTLARRRAAPRAIAPAVAGHADMDEPAPGRVHQSHLPRRRRCASMVLTDDRRIIEQESVTGEEVVAKDNCVMALRCHICLNTPGAPPHRAFFRRIGGHRLHQGRVAITAAAVYP